MAYTRTLGLGLLGLALALFGCDDGASTDGDVDAGAGGTGGANAAGGAGGEPSGAGGGGGAPASGGAGGGGGAPASGGAGGDAAPNPSPWTRWTYDAHNSRHNAAEQTVTRETVAGLDAAWALEGPGVTSTPVVVGDVVYFGRWDNRVDARSVVDGEPL